MRIPSQAAGNSSLRPIVPKNRNAEVEKNAPAEYITKEFYLPSTPKQEDGVFFVKFHDLIHFHFLHC